MQKLSLLSKTTSRFFTNMQNVDCQAFPQLQDLQKKRKYPV